MTTTATTRMREPNQARLELEAAILDATRAALGRQDLEGTEILQAVPAIDENALPNRPGEFRVWLPSLKLAVAVRLRRT